MPPTRRLSLAALALLPLCAAAAARSVTDSAGRTVEIPDHVARVFAAGPPASTRLYVLAPGDMIGWNRAPRPAELPFLLPAVRGLPEFGRLTGRADTLNLDALIARALAQRAGVVVVDEPMASLDLGDRIRVEGVVRRLADHGLAVLVSTHEPEQAFAVADRVAMIETGGRFEAGPVARLLTAECLSRLCGVDLAVEETPSGRRVWSEAPCRSAPAGACTGEQVPAPANHVAGMRWWW